VGCGGGEGGGVWIIFDMTKINSHTISAYINNIHNNIKLNNTYEEHDSIDYLDLTMIRKHKKLEWTFIGNRPPQTRQLTLYLTIP
jgi:hypothetical protein